MKFFTLLCIRLSLFIYIYIYLLSIILYIQPTTICYETSNYFYTLVVFNFNNAPNTFYYTRIACSRNQTDEIALKFITTTTIIMGHHSDDVCVICM